VEPNYEKQMETLEELLDSDVVYGYQPSMNYARDTRSYTELVKLFEHKEQKENCSDTWKCVERMITKRDIAFVTSPFFVKYVARKMGTVNVDEVICSLDQVKLSAVLTVIFKKGNPLLDTFNNLMRRYLEAGLMEMLWTELQHRASLRGRERFREAAGDMYFAFSVSHLKPAFVVLLVGTVLSSVVFIVEVIVNCLCKCRYVIAELIVKCLCKCRKVIAELIVKCLCKCRNVIAELIVKCLYKCRRKYSQFRRMSVVPASPPVLQA
jgi:hypothetical protein